MPTTAILFDLGETLWHFPLPAPQDVLHARCAEQITPLFEAWGVSADGAVLSRRLLAEVEGATAEAAITSLISPDFIEILDRVCGEAGLNLNDAQLAALWAAWSVDGARMGRQLYPDTITTLAWAKSAGYRVGLISNRWFGRELLEPELARCGLGDAFDAIAVSCDVGWLKPHPEIFYAALSGLGTDADQTVMVGDSARADITGAKLLGMRAVWKRNGRRNQQSTESAIRPDAMIDDLWELRRVSFLARDEDALLAGGALPVQQDRFED